MPPCTAAGSRPIRMRNTLSLRIRCKDTGGHFHALPRLEEFAPQGRKSARVKRINPLNKEHTEEIPLELKQIMEGDPELAVLERINREAFPDNEYIPIREFYPLNPMLQVDVWAMMVDGIPSGFTVTMKHGTCVYIFYLAVDSGTRGAGFGSQMLAQLPELYPGCQVVVDFEAILPEAKNNAQRIRRTGFYLRNGFHPTTLHLHYMQDEFVAAWEGAGEAFDRKGFLTLCAELHRLAPDFDPWYDDKPFVDGKEH